MTPLRRPPPALEGGRLLLAAVLLVPAACRKAPPAVEAPKAVAPGAGLRRALAALPAVGSCASVVAPEWAEGWPVPAGGGPSRFAVFFYPLGGDPVSGPRLGAPAAKASFDAEAGTVSTCEALPAAADPPPGPRWPKAAQGLDMKGFEGRIDALYAAAEKAAAAYAAGDASSPAAEEYWSAFDGLAEPAFRDDYYRLDPPFWEWLRNAGGASLDKPKR
ncbi:MAG: hypothetical protein KGL53_10275 [Elusimicrobia bacterium]|nr:hypothetical protein [Elusimicrobiota bacterium]